MEKISAPRGMKDVLPDESGQWQALEALLRDCAARFGFRDIRFPALEHTELFLRGIGDTTDVVQKEMYTFTDKGGRSVTLRPEGTASVVRAFIEHGLYVAPMPLKCFYIAPNFRYENPQAGRLRQHHQFGAEMFGAAGPEADAELIAMAGMFIGRLGLRGVTLRLNSLGCPDCRPAFQAALRTYFESRRAELCPTCLTRLERNPLRILDCKSPECAAVAAGAPDGLSFLCGACAEHFSAVQGGLTAVGVDFAVDPRIVRGLDYYTRTVFEFVSDALGAQSTVCAGGRYDGLVGQLGGPDTPALGFGTGLERLLLVRQALGLRFDEPARCDVYIASLGEAAGQAATSLCAALRARGVRAERDLCARGLKAQMKYADKLGAGFTVVLGENELASGMVGVKNMRSDGAVKERLCPLDAGAILGLINSWSTED